MCFYKYLLLFSATSSPSIKHTKQISDFLSRPMLYTSLRNKQNKSYTRLKKKKKKGLRTPEKPEYLEGSESRAGSQRMNFIKNLSFFFSTRDKQLWKMNEWFMFQTWWNVVLVFCLEQQMAGVTRSEAGLGKFTILQTQPQEKKHHFA